MGKPALTLFQGKRPRRVCLRPFAAPPQVAKKLTVKVMGTNYGGATWPRPGDAQDDEIGVALFGGEMCPQRELPTGTSSTLGQESLEVEPVNFRPDGFSSI